MELRNINTFLHIAELHSFSRTARHLGYSQSAVSSQIAQLEAELGAPLFDRVGKTVRKLLDGVTHKMLSNQLKELAADGLVQRIDYNEVPPRVEYRLTENGEALMPIFDDIQKYIRRQSCGDCCKQETRHTCCE